MSIYFNSLDKKCKSITGPIPDNADLLLKVYATEAKSVLLDINKDGESSVQYPMEKGEGCFFFHLKLNELGLYFYRFIVDGEKYGRGKERNAEVGAEASFQLTVYDRNFKTPEWLKGGIMYQIFPDRFAKKGDIAISGDKILRSDWGGMPEFRPDFDGIVRNNDFFGGNLKGITSKLDYLKSLHVTTLYLNPIFESASNHRYDTGNYMKIDSLLGTEKDFKKLVDEAKKRGIHIILDGVFNHTGDDSLYFNRYGHYDTLGAYQSKDSEYYSWYNFYAYPNGYESWWGINTLPAVNEHSEGYRNFIFGEDGVIKNWLSYGIGGYRLDVADELPDFFLQELRQSVKSKDPDAVIIGEVWEDASNKVAYSKRRTYFQGTELDSVMNYPLKNAIINFVSTGNTENLIDTVQMLVDHYPKCVLDCLMNNLSTHDTARILTVFGGKTVSNKEEMSITFLTEEERAKAIEKVKLATFLQYTMPGIPCVYYGDENGMEGYSDPFCRRCFDWDNLNKDLIDFYKKLGEIRTKLHDILAKGEYIDLFHSKDFMLFARVTAHDKCVVYVNNSRETKPVTLDGKYAELLSGKTVKGFIEIQPNSYGILYRK